MPTLQCDDLPTTATLATIPWSSSNAHILFRSQVLQGCVLRPTWTGYASKGRLANTRHPACMAAAKLITTIIVEYNRTR